MAVREEPVTVIVTGRNSESTVRECVESLAAQDWPIAEILVFDNGSTDSSREIVAALAAKSAVRIRPVDGGRDGFICSAFNRGVRMAATEIVVLCHSDGMIPDAGELRKLVRPLVDDPAAVASYPRLLMPREVWERFPFWQRFLFVRAVGSTAHSRCAIFDAVRKSAYLEAGGFDERRFFAGCGYGGEDNDAQVRIGRLGRQVMSEARAVHLHGFSPDYGFGDYLAFRKLLARTYGMQLRWQGGLSEAGNLLFFVRPALALLPFAAWIAAAAAPGLSTLPFAAAFALQLAFAAVNSRKMFLSRRTLADWRILLVLPAAVFMIHYETVWFFEGLFRGARTGGA